MSDAQANQIPPGQRWIVRVYRSDAGDPQVYEHVKHVWWQAGDTVLSIMHYYLDGSHRYVNIPRERIVHYTVTREPSSEDQRP